MYEDDRDVIYEAGCWLPYVLPSKMVGTCSAILFFMVALRVELLVRNNVARGLSSRYDRCPNLLHVESPPLISTRADRSEILQDIIRDSKGICNSV